ncbi:YcnI family protein [Streptomyces sp. 549]|uniref:YcnI family copper-binding membrane protein n=1 Tax=Streptomyces sp. 549 TaxID=3049076 RepID=UPI0024C4675F|nr:YcnI family protein [Streptomyces sp. 549]MDK1474977.1 YcnI family protein [Streptomyces sp. 549]
MTPSMPSSRPVRRAAATTALAAASVLALSGPAFAHVTVDPSEAPGGGYATLNFKVPNERDDASTTKLEITLPTDHPLATAMPEPVPGWDVKVESGKLEKPLEVHGEKIDEAPVKITWSGGTIEPGTFQRFPVSVGRLTEDADQLVFKAVQTYDNKEVVRWIEVAEDGGEEPDFPAPVLSLGEGGDDHHGHGDDDGKADGNDTDKASDDDTEKTAAGSHSGGGTDTTARVLGGLGLAAGVGGIAYGVLAGRRRNPA